MLWLSFFGQVAGSAIPIPAIVLRWEVPAAARGCPGARWFRREVADDLGRDPFVRGGGPASVGVVRVRASRVAGSLALEVGYTAPGERDERTLGRSVASGGRCRAQLSAAVDALHDVILPRELPTATSATIAAATAPSSTALERTVARVDTVAAAPPPRWQGRVVLVGGGLVGGVPAPVSPLAAVSLYVSWGALAVTAGATVEPLAGGQSAPRDGATWEVALTRAQADLGACLARPPLLVCGLAVGRWLWARAPTSEGEQTGWQLGGGLRVEARFPVGAALDLLARLDAAATGPKTFRARDGQGGPERDFLRVGELSAALSLGVALRLW